MKKTVITIFLNLFFFIISLQITGANHNQSYKLWYQQPAGEWMESTPLGNGRLGMMVYGGIETETICLNEITMWSGQYDKFQERPCGKETLSDIRQLFFEGKYAEGNQVASEILGGTPHSFGSHVPTGDLKINFKYPGKGISNYKRELNLDNAVNTVTFNVGNTRYTREYFCSNPDDVFVVHLTANKAKALNFDLSLDLLVNATIAHTHNSLEFSGKVSFPRQGPGGVNFMGKVIVTATDGNVFTSGGKLVVENARSATVVVDLRTDYNTDDYREKCIRTVNEAVKQKYNVLKENHIKDYSKLYARTAIFLGESNAGHLPTDKRRERMKEGKEDPGMDALFFQYARYLLIAASRENSPLPANLQGVWNDNLACNSGWTNDYHLDINTQQNYWLSNIGNLHECNTPLFNYIKDLSVYGRKTADKVYGAGGWTAHTVANVWGYTASGSGVNWGLFPTAGAWIASHLWNHYTYTLDDSFLKAVAYPLLKGNAEFYLDYMVEDPNTGYLMTGPSTSPENSFLYNNQVLSLSMMPACDRQLVYEAFSSCIEASELLNIDEEFRKELQSALAKLPPIKIGKNGAIQEWFEDFEEAQPNHRHTTHLLGLYPFAQISPVKTPELAVAASKTIQGRLSAEGWEDVEWSRANMICFYARLFDKEKAYESVVQLQREFARENLLTISPEGIGGAPSDIFVYDGNQAGGAGIAEMLVQSHEGYIEFLPALPVQWNTGYFKGLCVKGGAETSVNWKDSKITKAVITASVTNHFTIKLPEGALPRFLKNGKRIEPERTGGFTHIELKRGETLVLIYK